MFQSDGPKPAHDQESNLDALLKSVDSMYGMSSFSLLGDIYDIAQRRFGFVGTLDEAFDLLRGASFEFRTAPGLKDIGVRRPFAD